MAEQWVSQWVLVVSRTRTRAIWSNLKHNMFSLNKTLQNNSELKQNCGLVLTVCMFIIKIKLNNVHNKQHSRDFHAFHHNFVSIIK